MMNNQPKPEITDWTVSDPCPTWCNGCHEDDDHQEDQAHYSTSLSIPVITPTDATYLKRGAKCLELMVEMRQFREEEETWVFIGNAEDTTMSIEISLESTKRLNLKLSALLAIAN